VLADPDVEPVLPPVFFLLDEHAVAVTASATAIAQIVAHLVIGDPFLPSAPLDVVHALLRTAYSARVAVMSRLPLCAL
jgi:hypothetical protein